MTRVNSALAELYMNAFNDKKEKTLASFDDISRGVLLALIKERPTIWNSSAKLTKDDVIASFKQISAILLNMNSEYELYVIIEKWCWVSEVYMRGLSMNPPGEWRYNNTLDHLRPFNSISYPYLGCISKNRLKELTKWYGDAEVTKIMEATESFESPPGIFRDEMALLAGEDVPRTNFESEVYKTVGQMVNAKRRGRPSKMDKRSPTEQFINLTPQSAQFQKLLESTGSTPSSSSSSTSDTDAVDEFGLSPALYTSLIDMIRDKTEIWKGGNTHVDHKIFEDFGKELQSKFNGKLDKTILERLTGPYVHNIWDRLKKKFTAEESVENSTWRYFQQLQFLSNRLMPAFLLDNVFIKSEDSSYPLRVVFSSPSGSPNSEDSRMASSSPATQIMNLPLGNGKSIQTVLDNLVKRNEANIAGVSSSNPALATDYSELRQLLQGNKIKQEPDEGPPTKRSKPETPPPANSARMIVFNERNGTQPPVSTWVPPREDLAAKTKEEPVPPTPKRAQATAVIRSGNPIEKQLKKQGNPLIPVSAASLQGRSGLVTLNPSVFQQSALQQALSLKKIDTPIIAPSVSSSQSTSFTNGTANGNVDPEDKWALMGRMITMIAREVESRDPMAAFELYRDLQQVICASQIKSYQSSSTSSNPSSSSQ